MSTDPYPEVTRGRVRHRAAAERAAVRMAEEASHADRGGARSPDHRQQRPVLLGRQARQLRHRTEAAHRPGPNSLDRSLEMLDRASFDLGGRKTPATIEGQLAEPAGSSAEPGAVDLDIVRAEAAAAMAGATTAHGIRSDRAEACQAVALARPSARSSWSWRWRSAPSAWRPTATSRRATGAARPAPSRTAARWRPAVKPPERPDIPA